MMSHHCLLTMSRFVSRGGYSRKLQLGDRCVDIDLFDMRSSISLKGWNKLHAAPHVDYQRALRAREKPACLRSGVANLVSSRVKIEIAGD